MFWALREVLFFCQVQIWLTNRQRNLKGRILNSSFITDKCCSGKHDVNTWAYWVSLKETGHPTWFMGNWITTTLPILLIPVSAPEKNPDSNMRSDQNATSLPAGSLQIEPRRDLCAWLLSKLLNQECLIGQWPSWKHQGQCGHEAGVSLCSPRVTKCEPH